MSEPGSATGPASQLLRSAVQLFGTVMEAAHTRAELLTTEVEEEIQRVARLLLLGFAALLAGILGALIAGAAATKLGLFAKLGAFLLAFKKVIFAAVIGLFALLGKLLGKKKDEAA